MSLVLVASAAAALDAPPAQVDEFGGPGTGDGQLDFPDGVDHDAAGNRYVTDYTNGRVVVFDADGDWVANIGSSGTANGQFTQPQDLTVFVDPETGAERLLVADTANSRLQVLTLAGEHLQTITTVAGATPTGLYRPAGVEFIPADGDRPAMFVVSDRIDDRVLRLSTTFTLLGEIEASTLGPFLNAHGVAASPDGSIFYVMDANRHAVVSFDSATGAPLDAFGNTGTGGELLASPIGVTVDPLGFVYVASGNDWTVVKFRPDGTYVWHASVQQPNHLAIGPTGLLDVALGTIDVVRAYDLCPVDFSDVPVAHPFAFPVCWMAATGVSTGYGDGTYRPGEVVTRQAMAAFLYRLAGEPAFTPPATSPFSDVPTSSAFYDEITWAVDAGVATGFPGGTFRPTGGVSRQAMAAFTYRLAGEPAFTAPVSPTFTDVPATNPFFDEIEWMADRGIAGGFADGSYKPTALVSRQAMSAFMGRYAANG